TGPRRAWSRAARACPRARCCCGSRHDGIRVPAAGHRGPRRSRVLGRLRARCRSLELRWDPTSGRGTIWSFIVPHPPLLPAYQELAPYNAIVVALEQDPAMRFVGNLVETPDG